MIKIQCWAKHQVRPRTGGTGHILHLLFLRAQGMCHHVLLIICPVLCIYQLKYSRHNSPNKLTQDKESCIIEQECVTDVPASPVALLYSPSIFLSVLTLSFLVCSMHMRISLLYKNPQLLLPRSQIPRLSLLFKFWTVPGEHFTWRRLLLGLVL